MKQTKNYLAITLMLLISSCAIVFSQTKETATAVPANDFLNSMGANSAIYERGENLESTIACTQYTGLRFIRMDHANGADVIKKLYDATGVRVSCGLGSMNSNRDFDLDLFMQNLRKMHATGALFAVESANEPNNWSMMYQGEKGGGVDHTWLPMAKLQRDFYAAVKSDPALKHYPVWSTTAGAQYDNVGLQYLVIPERAAAEGCLMPVGTIYGDYANSHNYFIHPQWPPHSNNQTWLSSEPTSLGKGECLYSNYGTTWLKGHPGYTDEEIKTLPRVTTETGTTISSQVSERMQGLLYLSCYLAQYKQGWSYTAMYILRDRTDEDGNQTFGFFDGNYKPRLSAHYMHNLTSILADKKSIKKPGTLNYSIAPSRPETVHELLLQKEDGTMYLVVWGEKYRRGSTADDIEIVFDKAFKNISVYNPAQYDANNPEAGKKPIAEYKNAKSIKLSMLDHPYIVELKN